MQLTAFEERLVADAVAGNRCGPTNDQAVDTSTGGQWGPNRTVHADVLEALVTGALGTVHRRGVQLHGARVHGLLDLSWANLTHPLSLVKCYFDEPILARGAELRDLVLNGSHATALTLEGATVYGSVRLDEAFSATGEVRLADADIDGQLTCHGARLGGVGGYALNADGATVKGGVFLDEGFSATGEVRLLGADIQDQLSCRAATLSNEGAHALNADGVTVTGDVFLDGGFSATGEVRLFGADLGGDLGLGEATLTNVGGDALNAERAAVKGSVFLDNGFSADGCIRLVGADIGGLSCRGAKLSNVGGGSLDADGLRVKGSVFLIDGFSAAGEIRLLSADIGGELSCRGARVSNVAGPALSADGATVKGNAFLDEGFSAAGEIRLVDAHIGGQLSCRGAMLTSSSDQGTALNAEGVAVRGHVLLGEGSFVNGGILLLGADIGGQLSCQGASLANDGAIAVNAEAAAVKGAVLLDQGFSAIGDVRFSGAHLGVFRWDDQQVKGVLELRNATVEQLGDHWLQPLTEGRTRLLGFRYESFLDGADDSLEFRLAWIRSSPGYTPQPYSQLAAVYRRSGHDDRARKVLIAREVDRRKRGQPSSWAKVRSLLLEVTVAHGYEPGRAVLFLVVLWVIGVALLLGAPGRQAMVPTKTTAVAQPAPSSAGAQQATGLSCPPRYPCFNPWMYSAETVIPLVELGQTANWQPAGGASRYQLWVWAGTGLGWLFTTLGAAGVTGVIRKD